MYQFTDRVRYSEMDEKGEMTVPAVMNLFQDCSDFQSEDLGVGHHWLAEKNCGWVLSFWQVFFERMPRDRERYTAETRPWKFDHFFGHRNFALYEESGKPIVTANSLWTFLDIRRMRPARPLPEVVEAYGTDERLEMDYAAGRKLRIPEEHRREESFPVQRRHLDMNHHVNNVQYIAMACEYLPEDYRPYELRAEYRRAAVYGDVIVPVLGEEDGWRVVGLCDEAEEPYAIVSFRER